MTTDRLVDRRPRALGIETHKAGERVWCSVCRLDRMRRSRAARIHKQVRERRLLHLLLEDMR